MTTPCLSRFVSHGVTLLGDQRHPGGVTLAFTERTGGGSAPPYASLNLGDRCGDDPHAVAENRFRAIRAVGAGDWEARLVNPHQVHGDHVILVSSEDEASIDAAKRAASAGADAVVCVAPHVPVLLCYADCVPVVLVVGGGFAVVHSGWRGTAARVSGKALDVLLSATGRQAGEALAYIGPHIAGPDYQVSHELLQRFVGEFGPEVDCGGDRLDLARAIEATLEARGVPSASILDCGVSTSRSLDRFYSYRAEGGTCGRHGAIAFMS